MLKLTAFHREPLVGEQPLMHDHPYACEVLAVETMVKKDGAQSVPATVGLIMGSKSDWATMSQVAEALDRLNIRNEPQVISAHRSPDRMFQYAENAEKNGLSLIIAGAGGAAHLPGMTASKTVLPVIGVPVDITPLKGMDALLSIMQMPAEVAVATVNVGRNAAVHAAHFAATILAVRNLQLYPRLRDERSDLLAQVKPPIENPARSSSPQVFILAGSDEDRKVMRHSEEYLGRLDCGFSVRVVDPATSLNSLIQITREAEDEGAAVFIAGSGQGIKLARNIGQTTMRPVLAVPILPGSIECLDTFLKPFLDMPSGVATFAVNRAGAVNAALFAANILSGPGSEVRKRLKAMQEEQRKRVIEMDDELQEQLKNKHG